MNDQTSGSQRLRRAGRRQAGVLAAATAAIALLAAACGSGGGSTGASTAHETTYQRELAFAQCMRSHGLPRFPDPQSDGTFNSTRQNGAGAIGSPQYQSADQACAHLEGPAQTPAQFQQSVSQALKFATCMRAHGILTFQATVQGDRIAMGANGADPASPQFQSAQRACGRPFGAGS